MTNEYKTHSLPIAAALQLVSIAKLIHIEKLPGTTKSLFVFDRSADPHFDEIIERFFSKQLPVDACSYFESLRFIKSRLYEEQI